MSQHADPEPTAQVARAEMRPWSDYEDGHLPSGGALLQQLALDLVGDQPGSVLILGPHEAALVAAVAERASATTLLVRSTTDAAALQAQLPAVGVVAGGLDGFLEVADPARHYDWVLALDGLDRLMSFDSEPTDWTTRRELLTRAGGGAQRIALSLPHLLSPYEILDARPARDRYGDDEFDPIHSDPQRPATHEAALQALSAAADQAWLMFGPEQTPRVAVRAAAAAAAPGPVAEQAVAAAGAAVRPLLASPEELIRRLTAAGRLSDAATATLVVLGAPTSAHDGYFAGYGATLAVADLAAEGAWQVHRSEPVATWPEATPSAPAEPATAQPSETYSAVALPEVAAAQPMLASAPLRPGHRAPATAPVSVELLRRAAALDLPGFAELLAVIGHFVDRLPVQERTAVLLDDLYLSGSTMTPGLAGLGFADPQTTAATMAAALFRLQDDLVQGHRRHPWPPWLVGEPLVQTWLEQAGITAAPADLVRGRQLADGLGALGASRGGTPALREALAEATDSRRRLMEAEGHIFGLERTIGFRDKQLKTREGVIRNLRKNGTGGAGIVAASPANQVMRLARRTTQVRSVDELNAGFSRVLKRVKGTRRR